MDNLTYILPDNEQELYAIGNAILDNGNEIYFEVPAEFDGLGNIMTTETVNNIHRHINKLNKLNNVSVSNVVGK